jgi:hypothetical protein
MSILPPCSYHRAVKPFQIAREVPLTQEEAFARLTNWDAHADVVPFTSMHVTDTGFVAHTGVGPLGFDDPMEVVAWDPPRFCRLEKRGRVMLGWAEISVWPSGSGSKVVWREVAHLRGVPRALAGVERAAGTAVFRRVLRRLTRT